MWLHVIIPCRMPYKDVTIHSDYMVLYNGRITSWCRIQAKVMIIVYMARACLWWTMSCIRQCYKKWWKSNSSLNMKCCDHWTEQWKSVYLRCWLNYSHRRWKPGLFLIPKAILWRTSLYCWPSGSNRQFEHVEAMGYCVVMLKLIVRVGTSL